MTERLLNTTNQPMQIPGHRSSGTNFARVAIGQIGQIGWQFIFTRHLSRPYQHRHHRYIAGKGLRDLDTHKICWIVQSGFAAFVQLLPTIANNQADNFILLIIDNGSYGSTGDQPTYAGMQTSLTEVARACGCSNVVECDAADTKSELEKAIAGSEKTIIVCKCESGNVKVPVITMDPVVIRDRFMKQVSS